MLEAQAHHTPMMLPESIKRSKGEGVKEEKLVVPLIDSSPRELSLRVEGDTMTWLYKWHHHDQT